LEKKSLDKFLPYNLFQIDLVHMLGKCVIPGQNGYIGSCRTGFKSVATSLIGSGRLLFVGFRCYPLYSFDIRWSDSPNSDKILTVGIGQIRSQDLFASDVIQGNLVSRNRRILWFYMTSDFMIKPFNHRYRNLSNYIRIQEFHWLDFFVSDRIDPTGISYWCIYEIIRKLCTWFSVMASVLLKK
jgi:hypothetical protein